MHRNIYIFRHGETDWNVEGKFQGHIDIPLNDKGRSQAQDLKSKLCDKKLECVICSDLSRAQETAQIATSELNIPIILDKRLREVDIGKEVEGKTRQDVKERWGKDILKRWFLTNEKMALPGGESKCSVELRAKSYIEEFISNNSYQNIAISTHGFLLLRVLASIDPTILPEMRIPNGHPFHIKIDDDLKWSWNR